MWHPQAIDTFDTYFQSRSIFSESKTEGVWTTSITLVYWFLKSPDTSSMRFDSVGNDDRLAEENNRFFEKSRFRGLFPPSAVRRLKGISKMGSSTRSDSVEARTESWHIEERSTALVVTGSVDGQFWICSLWSQLIEADKELRDERSKVLDILNKFRHQPKTGRALVFLSLLGVLCINLHDMQEMILHRLEDFTDLGTRVFLQGYDWEADDAVDRLRSMMWGLESLRMLDERISASVKSVDKARTDLLEGMKKERAPRHPVLQLEFDRVLERFDKQREQLVILHDSFELKIRQVTGLRDGLSTVTNVQDSHTSVKQNSSNNVLQGFDALKLTGMKIFEY